VEGVPKVGLLEPETKISRLRKRVRLASSMASTALRRESIRLSVRSFVTFPASGQRYPASMTVLRAWGGQ
jgi:hypothetical protein